MAQTQGTTRITGPRTQPRGRNGGEYGRPISAAVNDFSCLAVADQLGGGQGGVLALVAHGLGQGHLVGAVLGGVVERRELDRLPGLSLQRDPDQLVGEPRVLGQDRAVEVGGEDVVADRALGAVLAVVAGARPRSCRRASRPGPGSSGPSGSRSRPPCPVWPLRVTSIAACCMNRCDPPWVSRSRMAAPSIGSPTDGMYRCPSSWSPAHTAKMSTPWSAASGGRGP